MPNRMPASHALYCFIRLISRAQETAAMEPETSDNWVVIRYLVAGVALSLKVNILLDCFDFSFDLSGGFRLFFQFLSLFSSLLYFS